MVIRTGVMQGRYGGDYGWSERSKLLVQGAGRGGMTAYEDEACRRVGGSGTLLLLGQSCKELRGGG